MKAQWISPLICEYPIHCLRPPQIAGGHLTSALKAKQPCSWKNTFIPHSVVSRAGLDCCDNAPRLREESQRASVLSCAHWAMLSTLHDALVFKKKGGEKKTPRNDSLVAGRNKQVIEQTHFAVRRLRQQAAPWWIRTLFGGLHTDLRLAISPPTWGGHEYRPRRALIPDPRATRGRRALKQEVHKIKRTNQIAVLGD